MHGPDGRDYQNRITFDEIVAPERIVYRHGGGDDVEPVQFKQTLTFEDLGGKTRLTWHGVFPTAEERARVIKDYGADKGLAQTMARLAEFVAAAKARARGCVTMPRMRDQIAHASARSAARRSSAEMPASDFRSPHASSATPDRPCAAARGRQR